MSHEPKDIVSKLLPVTGNSNGDTAGMRLHVQSLECDRGIEQRKTLINPEDNWFSTNGFIIELCTLNRSM